jgi:hypothetical protein
MSMVLGNALAALVSKLFFSDDGQARIGKALS